MKMQFIENVRRVTGITYNGYPLTQISPILSMKSSSSILSPALNSGS